MLILTKRLPDNHIDIEVNFILDLSAEERQRARYLLENKGQNFCLRLPRGTILKEGDLLTSEKEDVIVRIAAKLESVMTVTSSHQVDLIRAAYHLGNRHILLEVNLNYLRLAPDSVLHSMLLKLGLEVKEEIAPFYPEVGAYSHSH